MQQEILTRKIARNRKPLFVQWNFQNAMKFWPNFLKHAAIAQSGRRGKGCHLWNSMFLLIEVVPRQQTPAAQEKNNCETSFLSKNVCNSSSPPWVQRRVTSFSIADLKKQLDSASIRETFNVFTIRCWLYFILFYLSFLSFSFAALCFKLFCICFFNCSM